MIKVKSEKAIQLIKDLEELEILEVIERTGTSRETSADSGTSPISGLKNKIKMPMKEADIDEQLDQIRNEWQRNI